MMMRKWHLRLELGLMLFLICGCLAFPTPEHGGPYISEDAFKSLEVGKTRRADVLLRIGNPEERIQRDRFFVYAWERVAGYLVVGAHYSGGAMEITRRHYLCLEFADDGLLKRFAHLENVRKEDARKRLDQWMREP